MRNVGIKEKMWMSTLKGLKKTRGAVDRWGIPRGWIVFYEYGTERIIEIKYLYNPITYTGDLPVLTYYDIIELLEKEKKKKND